MRRRPTLGSPTQDAVQPSADSVGSTRDSYDNALAETVIGLFKTHSAAFPGHRFAQVTRVAVQIRVGRRSTA